MRELECIVHIALRMEQQHVLLYCSQASEAGWYDSSGPLHLPTESTATKAGACASSRKSLGHLHKLYVDKALPGMSPLGP